MDKNDYNSKKKLHRSSALAGVSQMKQRSLNSIIRSSTTNPLVSKSLSSSTNFDKKLLTFSGLPK